ncbi:MAG: helix-turn-helix domain-containing protein [Ruminococcus sp.]|nr:helix-turn-helix domain-containing protein [Ruminococcus sp.]MDE6849242.1 helix-turn-helix domain-containing protein [Ruminococcus sp.]MDE7137280.1 helix-turn-helix domain-containing protein [Ruminococcus sp.]
MRIILNIDVLYRLMREREIGTIQQLSRVTDINAEILYKAFNMGVVSKVTYWKLAKFFGCHVDDLQTAEKF